MLLRQESKRQRRAAFTLMEMLVVVAIIVALAGIGGFFLMGALGTSQKDTARAQVRGPLSNACKAYFIKHNTWPESLEKLAELDSFKIRYLESKDATFDPWGKSYDYDSAGGNNAGMQPDISTTAPDGEVIGNWPKNAVQR